MFIANIFIHFVVDLLLFVTSLTFSVGEQAEGNILYMTLFDHSRSKSSIVWLSANPEPYKNNMTLDYTRAYERQSLNFNAIAADYKTGNITFHDTVGHRIYLSDYITDRGAMAHTIESGTSGMVNALTIDWLAQNVYWVDESYNWIKMTNYFGEGEALIIDTGLERPSGIACHPLKGYLFWTELGDTNPARIERSSMSGKNRMTIITTDLNEPRSIAVDAINNRIYWTENTVTESKIESSDLDGNGRRTEVTQSLSLGEFDSISVDENHIFVSLTASLEYVIRYYNKITPSELVFEYNFGTVIIVHDICVTGASVQPIPVMLPCVDHTCGHFCVSSSDGNQECICRNNYMLLPNGTCIIDWNPLHTPYYIISRSNDISTFFPSLLHHDLEYKQQYIWDFLSGIGFVTAMTVDIHSNSVFYADNVKKAIYILKLEGGEYPRQIIFNTGQVDGMAVDWISSNFYWVDFDKNQLAMSSYKGVERVIFYDVTKPRAIAVDPDARLLFWTEQTSPAKLVSCNLDGTNRQDLINTNLQNPSGIALDYVLKSIYMVGEDDTLIYSINYDGTEQRSIGRSRRPAIDVTIYQDFIVLAETDSVELGAVEAINKISGQHEGLLKLNSSVYAIEIADLSAQPVLTTTSSRPTVAPRTTRGIGHRATVLTTTPQTRMGIGHTPTTEPKPGITLLIVCVSGALGIILCIILIVGFILMYQKKNRLKDTPSNNPDNLCVGDIPVVPQVNVDTSQIYESPTDVRSQPPTYESTIEAKGGHRVIEESPYLSAKFPHPHQVKFGQNNTAFYLKPEPNHPHYWVGQHHDWLGPPLVANSNTRIQNSYVPQPYASPEDTGYLDLRQ